MAGFYLVTKIPAYQAGDSRQVCVCGLTGARARIAAPASPVMQTVLAFTCDWMHFVVERGMLLGIKARDEQTLESGEFLRTLSSLGWILATLKIGAVLFMRRRSWGLIPLTYAVAITILTRDQWSAMAGFLWWGIIVVFVFASHPHTTFGGYLSCVRSDSRWFQNYVQEINYKMNVSESSPCFIPYMAGGDWKSNHHLFLIPRSKVGG